MDFKTKIEEIRQKPEHIRRRYVIILVAISMFFIIIFWIFSMGINWGSNHSQEVPSDLFDQIEGEKQSIKEELGEMNEAKESVIDALEQEAVSNENF